MRGFPPLQIFLLGIAFGLLAIPLANLTRQHVSSAISASSHDHDHDHDEPQSVKGGTDHPEGKHKHVEVPSVVRLRFAHKPTTLSLQQEGKELLKEIDLSSSPIELELELEISHDGNELLLEATWPEGTVDTPITVEIEPDGFETRAETRWSSAASLNEVLTFQW
jgi:hypothetical protein